MDKFTSKLSLYDILAMVIPGGAILLSLSLLFDGTWKMDTTFVSDEVAYCIVIVLSYIVGLANHVFSCHVWKMFRNNPLLLDKTFEEAVKHPNFKWLNALYPVRVEPSMKYSDLASHLLLVYVILFCISACAFNILYELFGKNDANIVVLVMVLSYLVILGLALYALNKNFCFAGFSHPIVCAYYDAYYFVANHRYNDDIFIMEGQVAFMQNMILPLSFLVLWPNRIWSNLGVVGDTRIFSAKLFVILLSLAICYCVYKRILKIHGLVWENYEFLKELENVK